MKGLFEVKNMMAPAFEYFRNLGRTCGAGGDYGQIESRFMTLEEELAACEDLRDTWEEDIETKNFETFSSNGYVEEEALDTFRDTAYFFALIGEENTKNETTLGYAEDIAEHVTSWILEAAFLAEMGEYVRLLDERIEGIKAKIAEE